MVYINLRFLDFSDIFYFYNIINIPYQKNLQNNTLYIIIFLVSIHATFENDFPTNTLSSPNTAYAIKWEGGCILCTSLRYIYLPSSSTSSKF